MESKITKKLCAFLHYQTSKMMSKLFFIIALLVSYTPSSFGQVCTTSPACPTDQNITIRSDNSTPNQWVQTSNLVNNGAMVMVIPPGFGSVTFNPWFSPDYQFGVHSGRILQHTVGTYTLGLGNQYSFVGTEVGAAPIGKNFTGLSNTWDNYRAVFGLVDNISAGVQRDALLLWQDNNTPFGASRQRLRFVWRDNSSKDYEFASILSSNGNFGINTIAPLSKLEVNGGAYIGTGATVGAGTGQLFANVGVFIGSDAFMSTAGTCALGVEGYAGFGTNLPGAQIHVKTNSQYYPTLVAKFDYKDAGGTVQEAMRIDNLVGYVGVNQNTPAERLDVVGNVKVTGNFKLYGNIITSGIAYNMGDASGNYFKDCYAQTWHSLSDKRLKREITNLNYGLKDLMNLHPVSYYYIKGATDKKRIGFVAQELQKIIPEVVFGEETDSTYLSVSYSDIIPVLVNAIKEQQQQIEQAINSKNEYITALEKRIDALENKIGKDNSTGTGKTSGSILYQNEPNPFGGQTTIRYYISNNFSQAKIVITDNNSGAIIKEISINTNGVGNITVDASQLNSGSLYAYSLVVDGKIIDTKKMILLGR